ncbi:MAG: hypothetical protein WCD18_12005 [Thermosynechococcaceae cyanobacterium]
MSQKKRNPRSKPLHQSLAIAALMAGGILQPLMLPVLAAGTLAGTDIINKATATYKDPTTGEDQKTVSNEITIKVAEVAGITNVNAGYGDENSGAVEANDYVYFDFEVTNTGNYTTDIYVPDAANVVTQNLQPGYTVTYQAGPASGVTANGELGALPSGNLVTDVAPDGKITVRVRGQVKTGLSAGAKIYAILGNTGANDNSSGTQDQPDKVVGGDAGQEPDDVRTKDKTAPAPANGDREASAKSIELEFANTITPVALAKVTKTYDTPVDYNDTSKVTDDEITYNLGLSVLNSDPSGQFTPAALEGTPINLEGVSATRILVADRLPAKTELQSVDFTSLPSGWQAVYATDTVGAGKAAVIAPGGALTTGTQWTVLSAGDAIPANVTRIGFIKDGTVQTNTTVSGFKFTINTGGYTIADTSATIVNMAQSFGQTVGGKTDEIIYDESGDDNANNYDGTTPPDSTGSNYDSSVGTIDVTGRPTDSSAANRDTDNNNTGSGSKGEVSYIQITTTSSSILTGPLNNADANGPAGDFNDDFTNRSTVLPDGTDTSEKGAAQVTPTTVLFNNTVKNPSATATMSNVTVQPLSASEADGAAGTTGNYGANGDIPNLTRVTVEYDPDGNPNAGDRKAVYEYNQGDGTYDLIESYTDGSTTADTTPRPVNVGGLGPSATKDVKVTVELPAGTPLDVLSDYGIPIVAFPDDNVTAGVGDGFNGESVNNITIDRIYIGYMKLEKQARIIDTDKTVINGTTGNDTNQDADTNPNVGWTKTIGSSVKIEPGQYIEYRITYTNVSSSATGLTGNSDLKATEFKVLEDGVPSGTNNNSWAKLNTSGTGRVTLHQQNTAADNGTVEYFDSAASLGNTDPIDGAEVTKYINEVGTVKPQDSGKFQFRRQVRDAGSTN